MGHTHWLTHASAHLHIQQDIQDIQHIQVDRPNIIIIVNMQKSLSTGMEYDDIQYTYT